MAQQRAGDPDDAKLTFQLPRNTSLLSTGDSMIAIHDALIQPPRPPIRSCRTRRVARWFGLRWDAPKDEEDDGVVRSLLQQAAPLAGQITLICGPSGSGKSSLLRQIRAPLPARGAHRFIDLNELTIPDAPLVDCFDREFPLKRVLSMLGQVGLAEAWTYLRTPAELSDGQRWRFRLALAISQARHRDSRQPILVCDEFAALLDRVTACAVSRALRRAISRDARTSAIVATSHDDLIRALAPDRIVRCDFGKVMIEMCAK
jgi:ABC-type ATPase with predicted acetyltransferase domain